MKKENPRTLTKLFYRTINEIALTPKDNVVRFRLLKRKLTRYAERLKIIINSNDIDRVHGSTMEGGTVRVVQEQAPHNDTQN